ncbi:PREDICTED: homeobox protein 3-like [Nelumbo nucifera]|uniref:Homeobox protein 3-like n=1 Tax=Nelumbo nucifera TaxID=4432 RepID=A0A1U7Z2G7_NELNU|nr:PREDICTED: homeobox protein 3-like [Nelumbo nucifera]
MNRTRIVDHKLVIIFINRVNCKTSKEKIKSLSDALAASGYFLTNVDQIHYLLRGLPIEYDIFVLSVTTRLDSLSSQSVLDSPSANLANKKKNFNHNQSSSYKPQQFNNDGGSDNSKKTSYNNNNRSRSNSKNTTVVCQLYGYLGHITATCRRYLELTTNKNTKQAHTASSSRSAHDDNWYPDLGATNHMTSDLGNLSLHDEYHGTYHITVRHGTGLDISHIGSSVLNTNSGSIILNNILRVPNISKNLLSIS